MNLDDLQNTIGELGLTKVMSKIGASVSDDPDREDAKAFLDRIEETLPGDGATTFARLIPSIARVALNKFEETDSLQDSGIVEPTEDKAFIPAEELDGADADFPAEYIITWMLTAPPMVIAGADRGARWRFNIAFAALEYADVESPSEDEASALAKALQQHMRRLAAKHGPRDEDESWLHWSFINRHQTFVDGMFFADAYLADYLEERLGDSGEEAAEVIRRKARDRTNPDTSDAWRSPSTWKLWVAEEDGDIPKALKLLGDVIWREEVQPELERMEGREPAAMQGVRYGDRQDAFAKLEKSTGALTTKGRVTRPSTGETTPVDVDAASDLKIDGEDFWDAPGVLRMIPQQWGVAAQQNSSGASATQLPLAIDPSDGASVAFRLFADSQVQLTPKAAKITVGLHLLSPRRGLGSVKLGALSKFINQGRSRPARKREREKVQKNLLAVRVLGVPENLDGTGANIPMFQIQVPESLEKDAEVVFGYTPLYERFLDRIASDTGALGKLNGQFIMNADGFMRISGNDSDAARMYLALCSMWNDANWSPDRVPFRSVDWLACRANQLSEQARRALEGENSNTDQLRQGRHATKKSVEKLIDEYDLADTLEVRGTSGNRELKILPNERHQSVYRHVRSNRDQRIPIDGS